MTEKWDGISRRKNDTLLIDTQKKLDHLQSYLESEFGGHNLAGQPTEGNTTRQLREINERLRIQNGVLNIHDVALYGDKKDKPGVLEDIRDLKRSDEKRNLHLNFVWAAIITSACERVFHFFTGKQ